MGVYTLLPKVANGVAQTGEGHDIRRTLDQPLRRERIKLGTRLGYGPNLRDGVGPVGTVARQVQDAIRRVHRKGRELQIYAVY